MSIALRTIEEYRQKISATPDWKKGFESLIPSINSPQTTASENGRDLFWMSIKDSILRFNAQWINDTWHKNCPEGLVVRDYEPWKQGSFKSCFRGVFCSHNTRLLVAVLITNPKNNNQKAWNEPEVQIYWDAIERPLSGMVPIHAIKKAGAQFTCLQKLYSGDLYNVARKSIDGLSQKTIHKLGEKILEAISALHKERWIHGDIKLENILITTSPPEHLTGFPLLSAEVLNCEKTKIKISFCDMGSAIKCGKDHSSTPDHYTLPYLSPERAKYLCEVSGGQKRPTECSRSFKDDSFATGFVLLSFTHFPLFYKWAVFDVKTYLYTLFQYQDNESFDPFSQLSQTPEGRIIAKLLHRNPHLRSTPEEALHEWKQIYSPKEISIPSRLNPNSLQKDPISQIGLLWKSIIGSLCCLKPTQNQTEHAV